MHDLIHATVLSLLLLLPAASSATQVDAEITTLFQSIEARLALMESVAAYKWQRDIAIEDLLRERSVLADSAADAQDFGLAKESSLLFFTTQIAAAKTIQRHWFQSWSNNGVPLPDRVADLTLEIRPQLSQLGNRIIAQIALVLLQLQAGPRPQLLAAFNATVTTRFLDESVQEQLFTALRQIKFNERVRKDSTRLKRIATAKKLVVATTGDYAPFSYRDSAANRFEGIDIDLARDLASDLKVELIFLQTSWPTLSRDLAAGKFDIAMSGISRNLPRQRVGFFSRPYHQGGKTPISRCDEVSRFDSLAKIDRPEVRVIVNPGGTNQKYVQANIHNARVIIHEDNKTIFDEITNGRADVMITDAIEVRLQSNRLPSLCASMPDNTLTRLQKAFLMPQDIYLKEYVDNWLQRIKIEGKLAKIFEVHLR